MVFTTRVAMVALIISDGGGSVAKVEVVDEGLDVGSFLGLVEREGGSPSSAEYDGLFDDGHGEEEVTSCNRVKQTPLNPEPQTWLPNH